MLHCIAADIKQAFGFQFGSAADARFLVGLSDYEEDSLRGELRPASAGTCLFVRPTACIHARLATSFY
jgi:hypothetical protein